MSVRTQSPARGTVAVAATLALAAAAWLVPVRQTSGMAMGTATELGSFAFFLVTWVSMTAAMMLPGAAPAVLRRVRDSRRAGVAPGFLASYLTVWTLVGVAVYAVYRPHGTAVAGTVAIAAGVYELTPLKRRLRQWCREDAASGFTHGVHCVGSSIGWMALLVAVSVMSLPWMVLVAAVTLAQRLLPARAGVDVPLAVAVVGLGVLILLAPQSVPGLTPSM
jgi:predicted metal-binding membrane protein